ncbi:MAG: hypothetical protein K8R34_14255, partial [Methanosarcinales archaeon]|nr:hypothetical protein [Methanosarcinales archaeon]
GGVKIGGKKGSIFNGNLHPLGPKILAAVEFVEQGGERAVVCRPEGVVEALEGGGGTVVEI